MGLWADVKNRWFGGRNGHAAPDGSSGTSGTTGVPGTDELHAVVKELGRELHEARSLLPKDVDLTTATATLKVAIKEVEGGGGKLSFTVPEVITVGGDAEVSRTDATTTTIEVTLAREGSPASAPPAATPPTGSDA